MNANAILQESVRHSRFWARVDRKSERPCWVWIGTREPKSNYGVMMVRRKNIRPHRFIFERLVAELPRDLFIDHLCRNRRCMNPEHMEAVTHVENTMRGMSPQAQNKRKTACHRGHPLEIDRNPVKAAKGWRYCPTCSRDKDRTRDRRKKP